MVVSVGWMRELKGISSQPITSTSSGTEMFNSRSAYRCSADLSIYVDRACCGAGAGQKLYTEVERLGRERGIENIISIITSDNKRSLHFHRKNGFAEIGVMRSVACKFGRYLDVSFFQKHLG